LGFSDFVLVSEDVIVLLCHVPILGQPPGLLIEAMLWRRIMDEGGKAMWAQPEGPMLIFHPSALSLAYVEQPHHTRAALMDKK